MTKQTSNAPVTAPGKKYILRIHPSVMERILKHLSCLKLTKSTYQSTRGWIAKAILEKLDRDESLPMPKVPKNSHVLLQVEPEVLERLENQVHLIKKLKGSYSLKSWIIDAVEEKLSNDAAKASRIVAQVRRDSEG